MLKRIILEEIRKQLYERESKTSVDASKVISLASKCNFFLPYKLENTNTTHLTFYYGGKNEQKDNSFNIILQKDLNNLADVIKRCGWVINQYGGHYDGLRNMYSKFKEEHPEFGVGTFFVCVEAEYGTKMDDYYGNKQNEILNNSDYFNNDDDYWRKGFNVYEETHLGVTYQRGIFYHLTYRKYLDAILRHGLKPKNGGGITRWRNTTPRVYLSLLPDFDSVDCEDDEENENDTIILRIDLRSVMKNFDFYVDRSYDNAVFTYSNIPPNFIQVISNEEIREHYSEYYLRYAARQALKRIVEKNFSDCDEEEKRRKVYLYSCQIEEIIMPKVVLNYLNLYGVNENYKKYIGTAIKNEVNNYVNS